MPLIALFCIQLIWASSYVAQKMALAEMPIGLVLIFRYGFAALCFLLLGQLNFKNKFTRKEWLLILFVGILNFAGSPSLQLNALTRTYAIDVSVLVAFEPLITALLAVLFLREKIRPSTLLTFFIAAAGVLIMASSKGTIGAFQWMRIIGDGLFFLSLVCEGIYSVSSRHLVQKYRPLQVLAWMMFAGFLANLLGHFQLVSKENIATISAVGWLNLLYLGLFCSSLGYGVWNWLLRKRPVNQLALSLFLQPLLGSALAVWILQEKLDLQTMLGGGIVLVALLTWLIFRSLQKQNRNVDMVPNLGGGGAVDKVGQKTVPMG